MSEPEVVVIGGGLAGISAACLLARDGVAVCLIEQDQALGGRMRGLAMEGFQVDSGLHCFHYADSAPLGELIREFGLDASFLTCENQSYILSGKERLPVPSGAAADISDVPGFTEDEAVRMKKWFELLMDAEAEPWQKRSVSDFLQEAELLEDELIRSYASALCLTLLGRTPDQVSAGLLISHGKAVGYPGFHVSVVKGGVGHLVDKLAEKLGELGVRVMLGAKVQEISFVEKNVTGVSTQAEEIKPLAVVYTGPVSELPSLLAGDKVPPSIARAAKRPAPVAGVALEFGLSAPVSDIKGVLMAPEEAVIGRFPSNLDPSLAPAGSQLSSWLALVPSDDLADVKTTRSHIRRLKKLAQTQFPELSANIKWERLRVIPAVVTAAPSPAFTEDKKLKPYLKAVKNLFVAGEAVAGNGVLSGVAVSSAFEASRLACKLLAGLKAEAEDTAPPTDEDGNGEEL